MALTSMVPEITTKYILGALYKNSVILPLANPQIKAEAAIGDVVNVNTIPKLTAGAYAGAVVDAEAVSAAYSFNIDQSVYNSVLLRDEQVKQSVSNMDALISRFTEAEIASLTDSADGYLAGLYATLKPIGANNAAVDCTDATKAMAALRSVSKAMNQNNIPSTGRWVVVGPTFYDWLLAGAGSLMTQNVEIVTNGMVGRLYGMDIYMSNNIKADGAADEVIIAGYNETFAYAHNVSSIEVLRSGSAFGNVVRALYVYGGLCLGNINTDVRGIALFANT